MRTLYICIFFSVLCVTARAQTLNTDPPPTDGQPLRYIVKTDYPENSIYIGASAHSWQLGTDSGKLLDREFSYVTPGNDFKQWVIHPEPGEWAWDKPDLWIKHCRENNQVMRLHSPISPQCSKWAKDDSRTPEELKQNLTEYMTELCRRYNKERHVLWMDVVNETVSCDGTWFGPQPGTNNWENPWTLIGTDNSHELKPPIYIRTAFEIANKYAPRIKQIINQHGSMEEAMWDKVKATVLYLREKGLRVDGIGWQAHVDVGWEKVPGNLDKLGSLIDWAHENDLEFHVTENNVWLKERQENDLVAQAETFAAILNAVLKKRSTGIVTLNLWGLKDSDAWHKEWYGRLFTEKCEPKPAYYAIQKILNNPPNPAKPPPKPADKSKWQLVWADEFDYTGLPDPRKWGYEEGFIRNNEAQYYTRLRRKNARVEKGLLIIEGIKEQFRNPDYSPGSASSRKSRETAQYTSASLKTIGKEEIKYGRIEVRAKIPPGSGVWPAIWTLGTNIGTVGWPRCGEIDIMEYIGREPDTVHANIHYRKDGKHASIYGKTTVKKPYLDFHIYSAEWFPDRIDFYFDNIKYHSAPLAKADTDEGNAFRKKHYLIINLALGGSWGGKIDDSALPARFLVDYVRVYREKARTDNK